MYSNLIFITLEYYILFWKNWASLTLLAFCLTQSLWFLRSPSCGVQSPSQEEISSIATFWLLLSIIPLRTYYFSFLRNQKGNVPVCVNRRTNKRINNIVTINSSIERTMGKQGRKKDLGPECVLTVPRTSTSVK